MAAAALAPALVAAPAERIKAVAFDAFPIFDPRPQGALAERLFPGRGQELTNLWRTRQFEYAWLRSLSQSYRDFWAVTGDALEFAARKLNLALTAEKRAQLMDGYRSLRAWDDVPTALAALRGRGLRLGFLSNFTAGMLRGCLRASGLGPEFELILSTDEARSYKPAPAAYQLGVDRFGLRREEILFVGFAGWDVAGAKRFGYPTYWVNRLGEPPEELGEMADGAGRGLAEMVGWLENAR